MYFLDDSPAVLSYAFAMKSDISIKKARLLDLLDAALSGDYAKIRRVANDFAQDCLEQGDEATAKSLRSFIRRKGVPLQASGVQQSLPVDGVSRLPLLDEEPWPSKPVIMNEGIKGTVGRFLNDVSNAELLSGVGLLTRFGLMLSGPPGTGKTLLAGHIAAQLRRPFFVARLDSLISSRLGETAKNIRQIFDFVPARGAVLFLDELDAIAKMRDDRHELGELKRVVNTVIQGLDSLDDRAVVIAATNHPQLLDSAIWRRFPYRCDIGLPNSAAREGLWLYFLYENNANMAKHAALLSSISEGFSGADIENLALATRRLSLLNAIDLPEAQLVAALADSAPSHVKFPSLQKLNHKSKSDVVRKLASMEGVRIQHLASMLGITRTTAYRYLQEDRHG